MILFQFNTYSFSHLIDYPLCLSAKRPSHTKHRPSEIPSERHQEASGRAEPLRKFQSEATGKNEQLLLAFYFKESNIKAIEKEKVVEKYSCSPQKSLKNKKS